MKKLILLLLVLSSVVSIAAPVEKLVRIPYPIRYHESVGFNAVADGYNIVIGTELKDYINDEDQLGLIILHEAHHNSLSHIQDREKEVAEYCKKGLYNKATKSYDSLCYQLYNSIFYMKNQERELTADYASFLVAKKIGYTDKVCSVFIKLMIIHGDTGGGTTSHPKLSDRYSNCMRVLK